MLQIQLKQISIATALSVTLICALPSFAQAKTNCYGASCHGKDPQAMGCSGDAVTLASRHQYGFNVELRYSRRCNAKWGRTTNVNNHRADAVFAKLGTGKSTLRSMQGSHVWSLMATGALAACGGGNVGHPSYLICTSAK